MNVSENASAGARPSVSGEGTFVRLDDPAQRIGATSQPQVVLVREDGKAQVTRQWEGLAAAVIAGEGSLDYERPFAVVGGPGTGKTSALVDAAVDFLVGGGSAEELMFVTPSKESASRIRDEIFERVSDIDGYAATGTPVRSVHSWAFAVYRAIRQAQDKEPPRLLTGAEHDAQLRILLKGEVADGARGWPEDIIPAMTFVGFARQLRDLLLRATERGVGAEQLEQLGVQFARPMWEAAGRFLKRYVQNQRLRGSEDFNASELMHTVLDHVENTQEGQDCAVRLREKLSLILVDDAHNLDPAAARFVETFIAPGTRTLIAGDPDQCVFHFRGADEAFLNRHASAEDRRIVLSHSHRLGSAQSGAVRALSKHLPHHSSRIPIRGVDKEEQPGLDVITAGSSMAEKLHVADVLRRAHVQQGVPWDQCAIIVRGVGQISSLRRVLLSHGVPVKVDPTSVVLSEQPLVAVVLLAVEAAYRRLTPAETRQLLESLVGGADPVMVRRVERALSRAIARLRTAGASLPERADGLPFQAADCLAALLSGEVSDQEREDWTEFMGPRELMVIQRVSTVLDAGRLAHADGAGIETVLWKVWQATELATHLQFRALRGGTVGSQADQDLDAIMSLFDMAGDFAERQPNASLQTFIDEVRAQELPTGTRERRGGQNAAVEILPAHAAAGREWRVVVVAGVQEDLWPAGPTVGGLFGQSELVDYLDRGITPDTIVSRMGPAVEEERRLFLLALSRASQRCVITAVDSTTGEEGSVPSRFLEEIRESTAEASEDDPSEGEQLEREQLKGGQLEREGLDVARAGEDDATNALPRVLAIEPLLAELRDAITNPKAPTHVREDAARNLAKMARAEVFGAHPSQWWGSAEPSTNERILSKDGSIHLSPSRLGALSKCALNAFLDRHRGIEKQSESLRIGNAVHAIAEAIVNGLSVEGSLEAVNVIMPLITDGPEWSKANTLNRWQAGITKLHEFLSTRKGAGTDDELASEKMISVPLGTTADGTDVVLKGRIDLMITDAEGATTVFDFKTTKRAVTKKEAQESPQLSAYQFMVMHCEDRLRNNGAALVFPGTSKDVAEVMPQNQMNEEELEDYRQQMLKLADGAAGPSFSAHPGSHCDFCDFSTICPAQPSGRMLV